jgi:hypothetical protein
VNYRTFESLVPRLNPSVPGCPYQTMVIYIRNAAIAVCEQTLAWRFSQPKFNLVAGKPEYDFNRPVDADVHAVLMASCNDLLLEVMTFDHAKDRYPMWADQYTTAADIEEYGSTPIAITQVNLSKYLILPTPDATETYSVRMIYALKPSRQSNDMDEDVFNDLEEVIFHGALQHLLVLPQVAWSDRELASYHAKQYRSQLTERRARANLGNARGSMSVNFPRFA